MILQTGMRTDIPAFYSEWFANRLKEGYVMVRNPYYPKIVTRYEINPEVVDLIGFCTKNPAGMFPYMKLLEPYGQYWFVTITPYGKEIEPNVPEKKQILHDFVELSKIIGVDSIGWRYDPILLNEKYTKEYHIRAFTRMCDLLEGYTHTVVISFIDLYEKVKRNYPEVKEVPREIQYEMTRQMVAIARKHGMVVKPCGEGEWLRSTGADTSGCMTQETYETALHEQIRLPKETKPRSVCACSFGHDIGAYDTCMHFCRYCYANTNRQNVIRNHEAHDPHSPLLTGNIKAEDEIRVPKQVSYRMKQLTLF